MKDLLNIYDGPFDVFVMLESARPLVSSVKDQLGSNKVNIIYFQPSASHRVPGRPQLVTGQLFPDRPAVIVDVGWSSGNSLVECLEYLRRHNYPVRNTYAWYARGEVDDRMVKGPYFDKSVFGPVQDVLEMITGSRETKN